MTHSCAPRHPHPFGQHQELQPLSGLMRFTGGSAQFSDFLSNLTNMTGWKSSLARGGSSSWHLRMRIMLMKKFYKNLSETSKSSAMSPYFCHSPLTIPHCFQNKSPPAGFFMCSKNCGNWYQVFTFCNLSLDPLGYWQICGWRYWRSPTV